ncbi:Sterol 3-beta-glucosyltransferase UGT80B1 [Rhizoctonia solani]|uniref:Sterol 3-beta-glucosyltransferase UGT80B1 n=1 Tax=Rhizoctonia solani TaxID=456999 RepID=A0A0K6FWL6_9AGAM|nr:Sterol 3-beta-glucosyltransferase UGT80B1 [Rhizoctonia solani]
MILTDDKTGSNETRSQAELSPRPSVQTNPFESASATTSPYVHASDSHESSHETAGQAPPTYSPSVSRTTRRTEMFITNGRPESTIDLVGASADSSFYPNEKVHLPEYQETIATEAAIQSDGRIQASFAPSYRLPEGYAPPIYEPALDEDGNVPAMSINIMIVGSRGDVQPYIALGQQLQEYGHTVRISTHEMFRMLVKNAGLMFFNIGGDPSQLTGYMDRNPSLIPGLDSLKNGDLGKSQQIIAEILDRCLLSCYAEDEASQGESGFAADLIISNPPTFAHIHCAEALGIPLHLSFTMPWSPTSAFPHPLVNIKQNDDAEPRMANYYSYGLVDMMTWQGLGRTINKFRTKRLGLEYLSTQSAVGITERASVPWTYCISPTIIPKPTDWMSNIDVTGYCFLNLAKGYDPPRELVEFIEAGEPPIYIGFGSIALENSENVTKSVLAAVSQAGVRAIISTSGGGLDQGMVRDAGEGVFPLTGDVPHDWLFERVCAVVHHGGAGTTAIGLKCGKPTVIVPFFGDQPWWAVQVVRRGAGPPPIHPNKLTAEALAVAIRLAISPETRDAARQIGESIRNEKGSKKAVESIHRHLPLLNMRCDLDSNRVAVWYSPTHKLRLSAFAAQVLAEAGEIDINKLELHRSREYETHIGPIDPVSGTILPGLKILNDFGRGVAKLPSQPGKGATKMLSASTLGVQNTFRGAAEGMHNLPKVYGGEVRKNKKVTGLGSGFAQGGKGFALGLYDGFSDFFMEPVRGFKRGGVLGAIGGVGIGALNLTTKPTAGFMQAVSMPIEGAVKEVKSLLYRQVGKDRIATRYAEGVNAARNASEGEREKIVRAFVERVSGSDTLTVDKKGKGKAKMVWKN